MTRELKLLLASIFMWGLGEGLFIGIYPLYLDQLGANPVVIGSIMSLSMLVLGLSHVPAGWLADRMDRKHLLVFAWVLATCATLAMYLAPSLGWFTLALVVFLLGGCAAAPRSAYLTEVRGRLSVQHVFTLYSACASAGAVLSPAVGGQIAQVTGIRTVIGLAVIIFVISTALMLWLRDQPAPTAVSSARPAGPLLANRRFVGFLVLTFCAALAFQIGFPLAPNYLAQTRHLTLGTIGLLGSFETFGMTALNFLAGHRSPRRVYLVAQALMAVSLGLLLSTGGLGWLALAWFLRGSWSLARNMTNAQVRFALDRPEVGLAYGLTETVVALALILGPLAAGFLYARAPGLPFQVSLALLLAAIPFMAWLAPRPAAPA